MSSIAGAPETGAKIDFLDGWRGLAIGALMIGHFAPVPGINFGVVGVELFFVLSGHLMARILFLRAMPLRLFYRRRISRVFPAFYVFLAAIAGMALLNPAADWRELGASALFLRNYLPVPAEAAGTLPVGHLWSLCVEEHSYVILALVALAARRGGYRPIWLLGALLVITYAFVALYTLVPALGVTHFSIRTECRAGSILVSALLACLAAEGRLRLPGWTVPFVILAGLATFWWRFPAWITYTLGSALLALGLNQIDRGPKWLLAILRSRGLMLLGLWSYSIYLWQQPFYLAKINPILGAALAVAAGIASFYLLESPVRRWLNRHWAVERRTRVAVV